MNRSSMWGLAPNGMSQSAIGIQIKEPLVAGWSFVAQLEAGFDPSIFGRPNFSAQEVHRRLYFRILSLANVRQKDGDPDQASGR
jgi:hypothetical protein